MKVFYIPKTPFGEFFYDPSSQQGVGLTENGPPLIMGMDKAYNPRMHPDYKECEIDEEIFTLLLDSASRYSSAQVDLKRALSHFPRSEICSPQTVVDSL